MNDVVRQMDGDKAPVRPFHVSIPEAELGDMRKRIKATRWPDPETVADESQGVQFGSHAKARGLLEDRLRLAEM